MALKVRLPEPTRTRSRTRNGWLSLIARVCLISIAVVGLLVLAVFGYYYWRYTSIVDERLKQPLFATTAKIYAAPREATSRPEALRQRHCR